VDSSGKEKVSHTIINIELKPENIQGVKSGKTNTEYTYSAKATNEQNYDEIYYYFDWGENSQIEILGPYSTNNPVTTSHIWSKTGSYTIKYKALLIKEDGTTIETAWSDSLTISISKNRASRIHSLQVLLNWIIERFPIISNII
jgi:hypothetical protein